MHLCGVCNFFEFRSDNQIVGRDGVLIGHISGGNRVVGGQLLMVMSAAFRVAAVILVTVMVFAAMSVELNSE